MKLLVFLGNIGKKYEKTRHNAGFLCGDSLQKKWDFEEWKESSRFFGETTQGIYLKEKLLFLKPSTLMNRSGKSVRSVVDFYKIPLQDIVLIYDDKDIEFGKVKYRKSGSSGGHKGVKDILRVLGTEDIQRIKIGVDSEKREQYNETSDFVLAKFLPEERDALPEIFEKALEKIEEIIQESSDASS